MNKLEEQFYSDMCAYTLTAQLKACKEPAKLGQHLDKAFSIDLSNFIKMQRINEKAKRGF